MSTAAEQEAERRYPGTARMRFAFVSGWNECESRHRELLEAAREYREINKSNRFALTETEALAVSRLLAAAAALDEEGGE